MQKIELQIIKSKSPNKRKQRSTDASLGNHLKVDKTFPPKREMKSIIEEQPSLISSLKKSK